MDRIIERDLQLMKKALCLSIAVIKQQPKGPSRADSDAADMKDFADRLMANDIELAEYVRSARPIPTGKPE